MRNTTRLTASAFLAATLLLAASSCARKDTSDTRVIVLGMDGMDPKLLRTLVDAGRMPNFKKLIDSGSFKPLGTSTPPQSPVAWSNFITGCDPSVHSIFDFIHRDLKNNNFPYLSSAKAGESGETLHINGPEILSKWEIPLWGAEGVQLLRRGTPFWEYITEAGHPATIFRMPSQYPPGESPGAGFRTMTGMGTPDLLGTYGVCSSFSSDPSTIDKAGSGAHFYRMRMRSFDSVEGQLVGPPNHLLYVKKNKSKPAMKIPFRVDRDPENPVARITIQDHEFVLNVGEWSQWLRVKFETGFPAQSIFPGATVGGICKFYLKAVRPYVELYVTPINIDPLEPFQPITEPPELATELAEATGGVFYTQGIPEDHSALSEGILNEDQYLEQAQFVLAERLEHLDYLLEGYQGGFFFFYFGSTDQVTHMFWNFRDPDHPRYDAELAETYGKVVDQVYEQMDRALGRVMEYVGPDDTLIVMSDHGFNAFSKGFNLNTWLLENGYLALSGAVPRKKSEFFFGVDWSRTRAYGLGINCLYLNLRGREKGGIVDQSIQREDLLNELIAKLKQVKDPETGQNVIVEVYRVDQIYPGADPDIAPDLLVGYNRGYRASWKTVTGKMPFDLLEINNEAWSGDHCVATHLVPGIIVSNRTVRVDDPTLLDLAPTILAEFGIEQPPQMKGRPLF